MAETRLDQFAEKITRQQERQGCTDRARERDQHSTPDEPEHGARGQGQDQGARYRQRSAYGINAKADRARGERMLPDQCLECALLRLQIAEREVMARIERENRADCTYHECSSEPAAGVCANHGSFQQ